MNDVEMDWLDQHSGSDLILSHAEFQRRFRLTNDQANDVYQQWLGMVLQKIDAGEMLAESEGKP